MPYRDRESKSLLEASLNPEEARLLGNAVRVGYDMRMGGKSVLGGFKVLK